MEKVLSRVDIYGYVSQILSRAFRNRFIELHYDDIPPGELITILKNKCQIPLSYAKKMIAVMKELQVCLRETLYMYLFVVI